MTATQNTAKGTNRRTTAPSTSVSVRKMAAGAALLAMLGVTTASPVLARANATPASAVAAFKSSDVERTDRLDAVEAWKASGYAYGDAEQLALFWGLDGAFDAKVKAGGLLLDGYSLPFASRAAAHQASLDNGLSYADALTLAEYWGTDGNYETKVKAGYYFLDGLDPLGSIPTPEEEQQYRQIDAYFEAGYDYDDAVVLADIWGLETEFEAKVKAGGLIKAEQPLPDGVAPFDHDTTFEISEDFAAVDAFFDSGYDYDDAVQLAEIWGLETPYDAKITAGTKVLAELPLPDLGA